MKKVANDFDYQFDPISRYANWPVGEPTLCLRIYTHVCAISGSKAAVLSFSSAYRDFLILEAEEIYAAGFVRKPTGVPKPSLAAVLPDR